MSDHIVKIIPADPSYPIARGQAERILHFIRSKTSADDITASIYEAPVFVDCGSNLETIRCPHCKARLAFDWWGKSMEAAGKSNFKKLSVIMPCCGKESSLNNLLYDFPCGFACAEFDILNPSADFDRESISAISGLLGCPIRVIHAHI